MKTLAQVLLISSVFLLNACSSKPSESLAEKNSAINAYIDATQLEPVEKVTSFDFHGWNSITDDYLILSSSPKRKYLLAMTGFCSDIRWAHAILVNRTSSNTLHARFDSVSAVNSPQMKCMIKTIYPLTTEQLADIQAIDRPPEAK